MADARHRLQKALQPALRIRIQRHKRTLAAALRLILQLTRPQRRRQIHPVPIQPLVRHLQHPADVRRLMFVQKHALLDGVFEYTSILCVPRKPSATSASRKSRPPAQRSPSRPLNSLQRLRTLCQLRKHLHLPPRSTAPWKPRTQAPPAKIWSGVTSFIAGIILAD